MVIFFPGCVSRAKCEKKIAVTSVVNSLLKLAKSIQCHLSNCLETYVAVDSKERWSAW